MGGCALIAGGPAVCHHANGRAGGDEEVHEGPDSNPCQERGADSGGNQTVLHSSGEGGEWLVQPLRTATFPMMPIRRSGSWTLYVTCTRL